MEFSEWFTDALKQKRMSGGEFAQRSKLSRSAVYFYLNGERVPDRDSLARIVTALGVSAESVPQFERKPVGRKRKS